MNRQDTEQMIHAYLKPIFGFALKRTKSVQDAEDLSQEIVMKAFHALLCKDNVADMGKFIWTIAHHALSNYYRDYRRIHMGVALNEDMAADDENDDMLAHLQSEIAYLSKLQREIVIAFYFENRKQTEIAHALGIPLGTVKWHLFEARKELKRGINTMRKASELKFNPIRFQSFSTNGSVRERTPDSFFVSMLPQNICYSVRSTAKTVNEIADDLGVSPVYVESEAEILEENGFLVAQQGGYIANFIINELEAEALICKDRMYKQAAALFANDLYDELTGSGILGDAGIACGMNDDNFVLWSLIPYIAGFSKLSKVERIRFEEAATMRPDGSCNIFQADVCNQPLLLPDDYVYMKDWCGPMWNEIGGKTLWQIDSAWTDRDEGFGFQYEDEARRVLALYERDQTERLSRDEYVYLAERGYVRMAENEAVWQIVVLKNARIRKKLLEIGASIKEKHKTALEMLQKPYAEMFLQDAPKHLRKVREYELQGTLDSNGWFLLHCVVCLVNNGKLKAPVPEQKKALSRVIALQ